jgi:SAM-dependent methyltransferase
MQELERFRSVHDEAGTLHRGAQARRREGTLMRKDMAPAGQPRHVPLRPYLRVEAVRFAEREASTPAEQRESVLERRAQVDMMENAHADDGIEPTSFEPFPGLHVPYHDLRPVSDPPATAGRRLRAQLHGDELAPRAGQSLREDARSRTELQTPHSRCEPARVDQERSAPVCTQRACPAAPAPDRIGIERSQLAPLAHLRCVPVVRHRVAQDTLAGVSVESLVESEAPGERQHRERLVSFFDTFAQDEERWYRRNRTYHRLIESVFRFIVPPAAAVLEVGSGAGTLLQALRPARGLGIDVSPRMVELARRRHAELEFRVGTGERLAADATFDYVVLSDLVLYAYDLIRLFRNVHACSHTRSRVVVHSYSQVWRPIIRVAELLHLKHPKPIVNWVTAADVANALDLAGFEVVSTSRRILFPKKVPLLTTFLNGVVANVWPFSLLCLTWWVVARPRASVASRPSVSVIVPCRNERGNVSAIIDRVPELGSATELVFVEGGSTDGTREEIAHRIASRPERDLSLHVQTGTGKADAVRLGFERAKNDVLLILDGDLSVDPEDLQTFYDALAEGKADFVNGSRLVYSIERGAMQFLNVVGNHVFSRVFTWLMDQHVKDTLCGTKGLWAADYPSISAGRADFGLIDPFGDFDLLLGAARRGLKIVDVPVRYRTRTYGRTNISRFRHGLLLLKMSALGFRAFKVRPVRI